MRTGLKKLYRHLSMADKIRLFYIIMLLPPVLFMLFAMYNLWASNRQYEDMIRSVEVASEFSLDFQKDYDYETYLLIVGNKTLEESNLAGMIDDAETIIGSLEVLTEDPDNTRRLASVKKYLANLEQYRTNIENNLKIGNRYEDNIEIWENDVQIVTSLVRETVFEYIYYEIKSLQASRQEYQTVYNHILQFSMAAFVIMIGLTALLSYWIPRSITRPLRRLEEVTNQVAGGDLSVRSDVETADEVGALSDSLNVMIDKINELLSQVTQEQERLRKAEFQVLQSQINPHFLYNTLDAIIWLAEAGEQEQVVKMVGSLSSFFRTSLNQGKDIVTVEEELQHVRSYLEIQKVRYEDILEYAIDVPQRLYPCLIPKLTIQPLVENALYHGVKNKREQGNIRIDGRVQGKDAVITVSDDGVGMDEARLIAVEEGMKSRMPDQNEIYGLYNVNERIRLNFGETYGLSIQSRKGEGTEVMIRLPLDENNQLLS